MNAFIYLNIMQNAAEREALNQNRRLLRDVSNPLSIPDMSFKGIFGIDKELAHWLLGELVPHLPTGTEATFLPPALKVFVTLHFLRQGSYQKAVGQDFFGSMSQSSVSRCIKVVVDAIVEHLAYVIEFPTTEENITRTKQQFAAMNHGFPGIVGCIDGTHVAIVGPKHDDPIQPGVIFYNRKGYYSLNVQIICDAHLKILNMNARFPGSAHDAAIWQTSVVRGHLQRNFNNGDQDTYLLGDAGYALEPFLLTPIRPAVTNAEQNFNEAHKSIRNCVERCNGVLKQRFQCLLKHRVLHYKPERASKIIYACGILHNLCITRNENLDDLPGNDNYNDDANDDDDNNNVQNLNNGRDVRNHVLRQYF